MQHLRKSYTNAGSLVRFAQALQNAPRLQPEPIRYLQPGYVFFAVLMAGKAHRCNRQLSALDVRN